MTDTSFIQAENTTSEQGTAKGTNEFTEPKLTFIEPKLTKQGDATKITQQIQPGFFGTFTP